jgi:tricorn protease
VFVAEDDLWAVGTGGGQAHRLTANPGTETFPRFSPDGRQIAYVGRDEGRLDVFVMPSDGGTGRRLTFFGSNATQVAGWSSDGSRVMVTTDHRQPFEGWGHLWEVPVDGPGPQSLGWGPSRSVSFQHNGPGVVIGRNSFDPARWKRYRGGRTGSLWIDRGGDGEFVELVRLAGNLADPMWIGGRIYFLSDHEGVGNIYSVTPAGAALTRHTRHRDFYARFASTDGRRVVYHCGADLWLFDPRSNAAAKVVVELPSSRPQRQRRFHSPGRFVESIDLHPQGHSLAVTVRGGAYTMALWEGAPTRHGPVSSARQRLTSWLSDGQRIVTVTDEAGEEALALRPADGGEVARRQNVKLIQGDLGRVRTVDPAPGGGDLVAVTNHRHEVLVVDVGRGTIRQIHRSTQSWIAGTAWSPDGKWLAFAAAVSRTTTNLFLHDTRTGETRQIGRPDFDDWAPTFDPEGRYLAFLSARVFDPVPDVHFHDYGFPRAALPMLIPLKADARSPFSVIARDPRPPGPPAPPVPPAPPAPPGQATPSGESIPSATPVVGAPSPSPISEPTSVATEIDVDGLADRIQAFPVPSAAYSRLKAGKGRIYFQSQPVVGVLGVPESDGPMGRLESWDFATDKVEVVADGVSGFTVSGDGKVLAIRTKAALRVVPVGWKDDKNPNDKAGRETGFVDLARIRVEVNPSAEWRQMFEEAWRLQRDHYWWEDMGGVDWVGIRERYLELVDRVASRAEFSDLLWEMQGELGTSHAYELGGDYRPQPVWTQGHLGADVEWTRGAWRIAAIPSGDVWDQKAASPLAAPGVGVAVGDRIVAIDGRETSEVVSPQALLVERAGQAVTLGVASGRKAARRVTIAPLADEYALRYRAWVENNRAVVAEKTGGQAGYIHIPDMGPQGFAEFHRYWKSSVDMPGLVIDVRFNRGGNVSQLLIEKLVRRRIGYQVTRWRLPHAVPDDAPAGPMVCLTNENAGSDGDIFSHTFKMLGLGPLIGVRTWGGVVGIWPQQSLVDGTVTTQPEFGHWFTDVGYAVENFGTVPDIEVINRPQDYVAGRDPQLERGIAELITIIGSSPQIPDFGDRPSVKPPRFR